MKKLFPILIVVLILTGCSTQNAPAMEKSDASLSDYLAETSCLTAKYDGDYPQAEMDKIDSRYAYGDEQVLIEALKSPSEEVIGTTVAKITAQCKEDFDKGGVDPEAFLNAFIESIQSAEVQG